VIRISGLLVKGLESCSTFLELIQTKYKTGNVCTHVTFRRVIATTFAVDKQKVLHILFVFVCVFNLRYTACNARAPFCHLWPAPLYRIFSHFSQISWFSKKKVAEHKMCFLSFCITFVWNISHSKKDWAIYDKYIYIYIYIYWSSCTVTVILVRL